MSIRDILKQREEAASNNNNDGGNFPEGVTRYVRMGSKGEVNEDGRNFVILAEPNDWFAYWVHEDKVYDGRYHHKFQKHTCLHSPREAGIGDKILEYFNPNGEECISCKAGAKRKMFFIIPLYDPEYDEYRVIDTAEFHVNKLIAGYDSVEKTMRKATKNKDYSMVGDAVFIRKDDKTYALESGDLEDEQVEAAEKFIGIDFGYEDLAFFRKEEELIEILENADDDAVDKSVLEHPDF